MEKTQERLDLEERRRIKREEMSQLFKKIRRETPLAIRLKTTIQMALLTLPTDLGYRPESYWTREEDAVYNTIMDKAEELTNYILQEITEWETDGKPE